MKIYFAGSIRGGREDKDIYFEIINMLSKYGEVLTEHIGDKNLSDKGEEGLTESYIHTRDVSWINESDILIAEVTKTSLGVGYEIGYAESKGKKILCLYRDLGPGNKLSSMLLGNSNLTLFKYDKIQELEEYFKIFFRNENKN